MSDKPTLKTGEFTAMLMKFRRGRMGEYFKNTNSTVAKLLERSKGENNQWMEEEIDKNVPPEYHSSRQPKLTDYIIIYS